MEASTAYLEEKGVYGLVEFLLADLLLKQPAQPFEWLAERVLQLQKDNADATKVSGRQATATTSPARAFAMRLLTNMLRSVCAMCVCS